MCAPFPEKQAYFTRRYHSLSPKAYVILSGANQTWTVPEGRTWYALTMYFVAINGEPSDKKYFHRVMDVEMATVLPAGTVITTGAQPGSIYYYDPMALPPPVGDAEIAYYARLNRLDSLPLKGLTVFTSAGVAAGTNFSANFPTTFTYGMLRGKSSFEVAWTILGLSFPSINIDNEISDTHRLRFSSSPMCPFTRSTWPGIRACAASATDDGVVLSLAGNGTVLYQELPDNW